MWTCNEITMQPSDRTHLDSNFPFPWFQLPTVNHGPEAEDPSTDLSSGGQK